jgi:hypothetical protein
MVLSALTVGFICLRLPPFERADDPVRRCNTQTHRLQRKIVHSKYENLHSKYEKFIVSMSNYSMLCYEPIIGCSDDRTGDPPAAGQRLWH